MTPRELLALQMGLWLLEAHAFDGYPETQNFTPEYLANPLTSEEVRALARRLGSDPIQRLAERVERLVDWVKRHSDALNKAWLPPNGDDYNDLSDEIALILGGAMPSPINITSKGR